MGYVCLFQFWFPQGIYLGVGLLGHLVFFSLVFFLRNSILSSIVAISISVKIDYFDILPNYRKELKHLPLSDLRIIIREDIEDLNNIINHQ